MDILMQLQQEFGVKAFQVENTVKLIDEGNTIPFIARYRKELTGSLDDQLLREMSERLAYLRGLEEKREQVRRSLLEQEKLTPELDANLLKAKTITEIDDIYRPFRPKRRTRATVAIEKGLSPLADYLWEQKQSSPLLDYAQTFVNEEKGVLTAEDALQGAMDIIAERVSDNADNRKLIRSEILKNGFLVSKATDPQIESVYEMYYDFQEAISKISNHSHRVLAVNRGEKEGILTAKLTLLEEDNLLKRLSYTIIHKNSPFTDVLYSTIEDSYKRLIFPSIEREIRNTLTEQAQESAIKIFNENLKQLLLQPPIQNKIVLALDPAFRTGCKIAVIDGTGKALETAVVYPAPPQNKVEEAKKTLKALIQKYNVELIAIGNGTASRESEQFVADMLTEIDAKVYYAIVNEAGASVYSASKLGAEEFPEYDVALRSAVSIGRRLQDPLAELVKIDPKSIGIGQYQHDMNQKRLGEALGGVVEGCVNAVGVDLNTASASLLSYVAGISSTVSKNILNYREANGKFKSRKELLKVPKLGPKAYLQCAGFLRIADGSEILDRTGVHPESYTAAQKLLKKLGFSPDDIGTNKLQNITSKISSVEDMATELGIGAPTLLDVAKELEKPGRDPRAEMPPLVLRQDVLSMEDLKPGMILKGTVRNITDFGAFVDIGVHQDGLVHISQLSNRFIKHPLEAVKLGDIISVKVLSIEPEKKRIALSCKDIEQ